MKNKKSISKMLIKLNNLKIIILIKIVLKNWKLINIEKFNLYYSI